MSGNSSGSSGGSGRGNPGKGGAVSGISGSRGEYGPGRMDAHEAGVRGGWRGATGTLSGYNSPGRAGGEASKESYTVVNRNGKELHLTDKGDLKDPKTGKTVGRETVTGGFMTARDGYEWTPGNIHNSYGISDPRNSHYGGYLGAKSAMRQRGFQSLSSVDDLLQKNMLKAGMNHPQRDVYMTAFRNGDFESIPENIFSGSMKTAAEQALETINGPVVDALGLAKTPTEAITELARDVEFDEQGNMGLKAGSVYERVFGGAHQYETPVEAGLGVAGMIAGQHSGGIGGKIASALGKGALTSAMGPNKVLGIMGNTLNLAHTAQVAGVQAPERSADPREKESGSYFPDRVQTIAARAPQPSPRQPERPTSPSPQMMGLYQAYGYTLI